MYKIKRYIDCYVPVTTCSLRCHYCYITHHRLFGGPLPKYKYSPEHVRKALSKDRLGGTCLINFCAYGETLLSREIVSYVLELLKEGHFVMIVTNGTPTKRFQELASFPEELKKHLFFKFSYHYLELKKRHLLDVFFDNIRRVRNAGCSFTLELTPSDEAIPFIDEIKDRAYMELGAVCHVTVARDEKDPRKLPILTNLSREEYKKIWSQFDSPLFDYKMEIFEVPRKEFCYAGDWTFTLNLLSGEMKQCYQSWYSQNIFENLDTPIKFRAIGRHCKEHHCYNGHSFLVLGDIPSLESPSYAKERNRVCADGTEWLRPDVKEMMSSRLWESNKEYSFAKKIWIDGSTSAMIIRNNLRTKLLDIKSSLLGRLRR